MALKSMKLTAAERKAESAEVSAPSEQEYPYGLRISLDEDQMAKLGLGSMPAMGAMVMITAKAKIVSTSAYQQDGGETEQCCSMQITDMEVSAPGGGASASKLYPEKD